MQTGVLIRSGGKALFVAVTLSIFLGLPLFAISGLYSLKFGSCLAFPNGTKIGYEAYINLREPYFAPNAMVKGPEGEVIATNAWPLHITEKATFGVARPRSYREIEDFGFVWTKTNGLTRSDTAPDLYKAMKRQSLGEIYYGVPKKDHAGALWFLTELKDDPQFQSDSCHTALVTW